MSERDRLLTGAEKASSNASPFHLCLCFLKGMRNKAASAWGHYTVLSGRGPGEAWTLRYACPRFGSVNEARVTLRELDDLPWSRYVAPSGYSHKYFGLGENDPDYEFLDRARDDLNGTIIHITANPFTKFIRTDPRYSVLLRKMNL